MYDDDLFNTDDVLREISEDFLAEARRKAAAIRCPTHGQAAEIRNVRQGRDGMDFEIHGCCDELRQCAERAIGEIK